MAGMCLEFLGWGLWCHQIVQQDGAMLTWPTSGFKFFSSFMLSKECDAGLHKPGENRKAKDATEISRIGSDRSVATPGFRSGSWESGPQGVTGRRSILSSSPIIMPPSLYFRRMKWVVVLVTFSIVASFSFTKMATSFRSALSTKTSRS